MFPTPLASDTNTVSDIRKLDVYLSENGALKKINKVSGARWSLPLSGAAYYLTPMASDGFRSTLKPAAYKGKKKTGNLSAQMISELAPISDKAALSPEFVEWLMGFPIGWTDVNCGSENLIYQN